MYLLTYLLVTLQQQPRWLRSRWSTAERGRHVSSQALRHS